MICLPTPLDCSLVRWQLCQGQIVKSFISINRHNWLSTSNSFPLRSICLRLWPTTTTPMFGPWSDQSRWISLLRDLPLALEPRLVIPLCWIDCTSLQSDAVDAPEIRARHVPITERKKRYGRERIYFALELKLFRVLCSTIITFVWKVIMKKMNGENNYISEINIINYAL